MTTHFLYPKIGIFMWPGMLSAGVRKTSVTLDEGTIAIGGKQQIANLKLPFFVVFFHANFVNFLHLTV